MGLIPNDIITAVIDRSDIVETIGQYIALKKAGRNFKGLCPFHHEKTPSFVVNPDKQIFHCFGCGTGGNVVGFVMRQERLEFPEALRFLAAKVGVTVPETAADAQSPSKKIRDDMIKANELALQFFHQTLLTGRDQGTEAARDYLKNRGINLDAAKQFQLGFAPGDWDGLLKHLTSKGLGLEVMQQAGLIIARENKSGFYDRFRNRVMFPIFDLQSRPVAFGGRALGGDAGAKYINSPETPVYTKGRHLFGLHLTKAAAGKMDRLIVVEGYMDMVTPFTHGVTNIAASLGTALTVEQIRLIRRYTPNVTMLFDTDPAGQSAIIRSLDLLVDEEMNTQVVKLKADEDPDSFIRSFGVEAFHERLGQAQSLFDYKLDWLEARHDAHTVEGRSKICQEMLNTIVRHKNEVVKFELTKELAQRFAIPQQVLLDQAKKLPAWPAGRPRPYSAPVPVAVPVPAASGINKTEEMLLALFLSDPSWVAQARDVLSPGDFSVAARDIVEAMWRLGLEASEWSANDLLSLIHDAPSQALVARLLSQDEKKLGDPKKAFRDCVAKIQKSHTDKHRDRLRQAIAMAEAQKNTSLIHELREEFNALMRLK
ncbi:MAG: DNA primase [Candidatus Omnitrophica bacterium]|nr:DNA primase [Candidatus Omnitrophota bacterium]